MRQKFAYASALALSTPDTVTFDGPGVTVMNGVFTVQLDFSNAFDGGAYPRNQRARAQRRPSSPAYTTLSPRQQITSTPYAIRSLTAATATTATTASAVSSSAGDSVITAINAGSSTINAARLPSTLATQNGANTFSGTNTFSTSPTFSAGLSAGSQRVTNITTQTASTDAATKSLR